MAKVLFSGACQDENRRYWGGKAGDQTGKEVRTTSAYNHSLGWRIFRYPNSNVAFWIGTNARVMADNNNFGYDQWERLTGYNQAKANGWEPANVKTPCELDCSSLVRTAVACALERDIANFNTANEPNVLLSLGFKEITGTPLTQLQKGDIVCTKTQGHTEIVSQGCSDNGGSVAPSTPTATKPDALYCVIAGGKYLSEVKNDTDWAGLNSTTPITGVAIRLSNGSVSYQAHEKGGSWLPRVTGYNWYDNNNGYAGNGKAIDGLIIEPLTAGVTIQSRAYVKGKGWLPWVTNANDYIGIYGREITEIQIKTV